MQYLLVNHLFNGDEFAAIVDEEDENNVQFATAPYKVDDLTVPEQFISIVDEAKSALDALHEQINADDYKDLNIFIYPIDGTREFSTGLGEQCSICIGFSDASGAPVAGILFRPITQPPTYAMGAASEGFTESNLDVPETPNPVRFLTSNGSISPFIQQLISKLGYVRVPSGGAGNKMLMLLGGKGAAYIQDRGVSRWGTYYMPYCVSIHCVMVTNCSFSSIDTCGAQAVIEAHGGVLAKMTTFAKDDPEWKKYTYLDFEENTSNLTPYNAHNKKLINKNDPPRLGTLEEFQPYSNICGLIALSATGLPNARHIFDAIQEVQQSIPPSYD